MVNDRLERGMRSSVTEFRGSIIFLKLYSRKEKGGTESVRHLGEEWGDKDPGPTNPANAGERGLQTQRYRRSAECK